MEDQLSCNNLSDDDLDGLVDRGDPGCATAFDADEVHTPECNDGIDNDSDGWIDTDDLICSTSSVLFEDDGFSGFTDCNDGVDSDGDGLVDSNDLGCEDSYDTDETDPLTECNDGIDNDGDGWTDLSDPICTSVAVELEDDGVNSPEPSAMMESTMTLIRTSTPPTFIARPLKTTVKPFNHVLFGDGLSLDN